MRDYPFVLVAKLACPRNMYSTLALSDALALNAFGLAVRSAEHVSLGLCGAFVCVFDKPMLFLQSFSLRSSLYGWACSLFSNPWAPVSPKYLSVIIPNTLNLSHLPNH